MRVLFINPPWTVFRKENMWRNITGIMPPLGLAWMAAVLEQDGHEVKILDAPAEGLAVHEIPKWMYENKPFDLVGITSMTPFIHNALNAVRLIKAEFPSVKTVLGGVHPTVLPEEVLSEPAVDIVVRGEGEETIREVVAEKSIEEIRGISWRSENTFIHNPERELINNLDSLPFPAYHLLNMSKYRPAAGAAKRLPATSILATRGCPGQCTFCYRIFGHQLRWRSGKKVAEEAKLLQARYGIREICFYDDTFTAVRREVKAFCSAIQELKINLTWSCFSRIDTFDETTFRMMREAGCHQVMFGVETYNSEILKNINKKVEPDIMIDIVNMTKKIGLEVRAAFMLGNPGETEETLEENIKYSIRMDADIALFNVTTPYPGTDMYKWADENNYLLTKDWKDYDFSKPVMELPTVSAETVQAYYNKALWRFYIRPRFILKYLKKLHSWQALISSFRGLRAVFKA